MRANKYKNAGFPVSIVGRAIAYIIPFLYANTVSRSFRGLHEVRISDSPSHLNSRHSGPMFREISRFNPSYFADKSSYFFSRLRGTHHCENLSNSPN